MPSIKAKQVLQIFNYSSCLMEVLFVIVDRDRYTDRVRLLMFDGIDR